MEPTLLELSRDELPCWCGCGRRWATSRGELRSEGAVSSFLVIPTLHGAERVSWLALGDGSAPSHWVWLRTAVQGDAFAAGIVDGALPFPSPVQPVSTRAEVLADPALKARLFTAHDALLQVHPDLRHLFFPEHGRDFSFRLPDCVFAQPPSQRSPRNQQNFADCGDRLFLRALLGVPVSDGSELRLGVWVEVPHEAFFKVVKVWNDPTGYLAVAVSGKVENAVSLEGHELRDQIVTLAPRTQDQCLFVRDAEAPWLTKLMKEPYSASKLPGLVQELERSLKRHAASA